MKKKVIKPFNLDEYLDNDDRYKVETKCCYPVRALKTNAIPIYTDSNHVGMIDYSIMAYLDTSSGVRIAFYTVEGKFYSKADSNLDLVLVEEQEITSVTKEEFEDHIEWFVNHKDDMIEELGKTVGEYILERPFKEDAQDAKEEDVTYCTLKLEGIEEMPNEEFAKSYVKFAVSCVNDALGYSAKKRNAFGWQKVWNDQGYFGVIEQEKVKKIIEKYPEFPFKICTTKVKAPDDNGKA